jgi:hypothetical protein
MSATPLPLHAPCATRRSGSFAWTASSPPSRKPAETLLKVDTQGYEEEVLLGAGERLRELAAIQLELPIVPLYGADVEYRLDPLFGEELRDRRSAHTFEAGSAQALARKLLEGGDHRHAGRDSRTRPICQICHGEPSPPHVSCRTGNAG